MFERRWLHVEGIRATLNLEHMPQWAQELVEKIDPDRAAVATKGPAVKGRAAKGRERRPMYANSSRSLEDLNRVWCW